MSACRSCPIGRGRLWMLGYPEAALADAEAGAKDAREIGQAATLMFALNYTSLPHIFRGDYAKANARCR